MFTKMDLVNIVTKRDSVFNFLLKKIFFSVYFWRERQSMGGGGAEREGDRIWSSLQSLTQGLNSRNREIVSWAETKSWTHYRLSHPGAPPFKILNLILHFLVLLLSLPSPNLVNSWSCFATELSVLISPLSHVILIVCFLQVMPKSGSLHVSF